MISICRSLKKRKGRGDGRRWSPAGSRLPAVGRRGENENREKGEGRREKREEGKMGIGMGIGVKGGWVLGEGGGSVRRVGWGIVSRWIDELIESCQIGFKHQRGVWIIGCINLIIFLMCILNYKDKLFNK